MGSQGEADPHGQAALLLLESLFHTLVENGVLTPQEVLGTLQVALEVRSDLAEDTGERPELTKQSLALLATIERSFAAYDTGSGRR